ncbi:MAG: hypothetical protein B6244_00835 [Candidatus Cloacimonetes bacterium 4572_55]|nr:MAG: hypothetical protein B6244_00835 [Candidatus Cloacimonetes bacterium 4572_55]
MSEHTFHIPVMGIGFTIDTPVRAAQYGISSVISLVDDILIEKMRNFYCEKMNISFKTIHKNDDDSRAKRITSYLNLINRIVSEKFGELKKSPFEKGSEIVTYFEMLPEDSKLKQAYHRMVQAKDNETVQNLQDWLKKNLSVGSIDVNIMTKLDKAQYKGQKKLPSKYNDGHTALRGFALSDLENCSVVLSAGLNPRLYTYMADFDDFYPDENGFLKKKITLKVSDYRSALIQGKFLAKKGLWVSEYRVESGLNCGGHAFATQGRLLGPILESFKENKNKLIHSNYTLFTKALKNKNRPFLDQPPEMRITVQGGVGTGSEHDFLLSHYKVDSAGWGSPFLLVPEVTNVDPTTLELLQNAKKDDLYLSDISPLGVPFNNLKGNTKDVAKQELIEKGKPGSACPKGFVALSNDMSSKPICLASRLYQRLKIKELEKKCLGKEEYKEIFQKVVEKSCICVGLGVSALLVNNLDTSVEGDGVSICPGPNLAYFSKVLSLKDMVDHIYNKINVLTDSNRPNMFIKELDMYADYLQKMIDKNLTPMKEKQVEYFSSFRKNLLEGIDYYKNLLSYMAEESKSMKDRFIEDLKSFEEELSCIEL